jgi:hypothetical protein
MHEVHIPCFPISERTTFSELPQVVDARVIPYEEEIGGALPMFIFDPRPEWGATGRLLSSNDAPERMVIVALEPELRAASFRALEKVQAIEPSGAKPQLRKLPRIKENTPLKSIFRQMEESQLTVFSLTFPDNGPDAITTFFLRTTFTIENFRRIVMDPENAADSPPPPSEELGRN